MAEPDALGDRLGRLDPQELHNLETLRRRLEGSALTPRAVGEVLPEAIALGDGADGRLAGPMVGVTERAIERSVGEDPERLSTALFPIIGAAIRKAMDKLVADMMQTVNAGLERALSFKRLSWRFESWRTGVPFLEIVMRETLLYRVEHVFLMHRESGILLREASIPGTGSADSDMVASMLGAVRDYIKDSLSLRKGEAVEAIKAGEYSLLIEDGPLASLAVAVRGTADPGLGNLMRETLEGVHLKFGGALRRFSGDVEPFAAADPALARCLAVREKREAGAKPVYAIVAVSALALAAAATLAWGIVAARDRRGFEEALDAEPGIVVARSARRAGRTELRLLRDPRARTVEAVAEEHGIDLSRYAVDAEAFLSPAFGDAPAAATVLAERTVPAELLDLAKRLHSLSFLFEQDSGELRTGQEGKVREAGDLVSEIVAKAEAYGWSAAIEAVGHAAGATQDESATRVSEERARKAYELFVALNAPLAGYVRPRGAGVLEPVMATEATEQDRELNRSVTFEATFR